MVTSGRVGARASRDTGTVMAIGATFERKLGWIWRISLVAASLLGMPLVQAQETLKVDGVAVDVTAADAVTARQKAIETGQRDGLRQVMQRLSSTADAGKLPNVDGLAMAPFVRSFEITDEKFGPNRYVASLNITYDRVAVEGLMRGSGVTFLSGAAPVVLVVPARDEGGAVTIWRDEDDPWRRAWEQVATTPSVLKVVLPLGDVTDMATLPADRLGDGDPAALAELAERYGAVDAVVAIVEGPGVAGAGGPVGVRFVGAWGGLFPSQPQAVAPLDAAPPDAMGQAASLALARLGEAWKRDNLQRAEHTTKLGMAVPLADLASWVQIRQQLETFPEIKDIRVDSFARDRAEIVLTLVGDIGRLQQSLARRGLTLESEADGWLLRPAAARPGRRG